MLDEFNNLICPHCGSNYLHQTDVDIYWRDESDKNPPINVSSCSDCTNVLNTNDGNPSSRRDGIIINFSCEGCTHRPYLTIVQHKGNTIIEMNKENVE